MRQRTGTAIGSVVAVIAGSLAALVMVAGPAGAVTVNDEDSLRAALAVAAETSIELTADIVLDDCGTGAAQRSSTTDLVIEGNGFSITQTCSATNLIQSDTGALILRGLTLIGGEVGIESSGPVTLSRSTVRGVDGDDFTAGITTAPPTATVSLTDGSAVEQVTGTGSTYGVLAINADIIVSGGSRVGDIVGDDGYGLLTTRGAVAVTDSEVGPVTGNGTQAFGVYGVGVTVRTSTVHDITVPVEGGTAIGVGAPGQTVVFDRSTLARVSAVAGTALGMYVDVATVTNSTFTGVQGPAIFANSATVVYSDIVGNGGFVNTGSVESADGIAPAVDVGPLDEVDAQIALLGGDLTVFGSVIAAPIAGSDNCFVAGTTVSAGYNVADDTSCGLTATGDRQGAGLNPLLGPLADNGGPTATFLPQTGSPLLEAIPAAACQTGPAAGIAIDQRGEPRPGFTACDIGSVELQPAPVIEPNFTG